MRNEAEWIKKQAAYSVKQVMQSVKERFPMLISAVNLLQPKEFEERYCLEMATDGRHLLYSPSHIVNTHMEKLQKELLHIIIHGLLGHFEEHTHYSDRPLIWVTMDRETEYILSLLLKNDGRYSSWRDGRGGEMDKYLGRCYGLGCYYIGKKSPAIKKKMLVDGRGLASDDHNFWPGSETETSVSKADISTNSSGISDGDGEKEERKNKSPKDKDDQSSQYEKDKPNNEIIQAWKKAGEMLMPNGDSSNIQSLVAAITGGGQGFGTTALGAENLITASKNRGNSYYEILMEHVRLSEKVQDDPDAIDPMLYHYGLALYKDVPLIESPEETEQFRMDTVCVAIDTSGSCGGEVASRFLRETCNIFRDIKSRGGQAALYFWTCDTKIQQEVYYESIANLCPEDWENVKMYGWGGTAFEPVFKRIDELKKQNGEAIDCLIYLTDGQGSYPKEKPDYPVYFILPHSNRNGDYEDFPDWIHYIELNE